MHNEEQYGGMIRLAYQQDIAMWVPVEGSEIITKKTHVRADWELQESEWFELPTDVTGVSCIWIQAQAEPLKKCRVALATLVIAEE